ncbi:MAG TPA: cytochrome c family protein [Xanthobacteraceae bacterium]|jgi:cytochrome c
MRSIFAAIVGVTATISGAFAQGTGDASKAQMPFQQCQVCHKVGPGAQSGIGPALNGIFGQKAGAVPGFNFSPAMKQAASKGLVWNAANLDKFLENPQGFLPGTAMTYLGLKDAQQRADVIAYLETLKPQ